LGLCEHCGLLLSIEDLPIEAMDAEWRCPKCEGILNGQSFGYEGSGQEYRKVLWVGRDGKWTKEKPTEPFDLGSWHIIIRPRVF
jgi:hypothetical protein